MGEPCKDIKIPKGVALVIFCFQSRASKLLMPEKGLTALIPNGGALQGHQNPQGLCPCDFLFSKHSQASSLCFENKKSLSKTGILRHLR
jgi:hypothetical protein